MERAETPKKLPGLRREPLRSLALAQEPHQRATEEARHVRCVFRAVYHTVGGSLRQIEFVMANTLQFFLRGLFERGKCGAHKEKRARATLIDHGPQCTKRLNTAPARDPDPQPSSQTPPTHSPRELCVCQRVNRGRNLGERFKRIHSPRIPPRQCGCCRRESAVS